MRRGAVGAASAGLVVLGVLLALGAGEWYYHIYLYHVLFNKRGKRGRK